MSLYKSIYKLSLILRGNTTHLSYGRHIIEKWAVDRLSRAPGKPAVLDIGCGKGDDLARIREKIGPECQLFGVEGFDEYRQICLQKGITTVKLDIERETFPYPDEFFDVVIINQVLEHVKDVFYVVSEISRIVKKKGVVIIGVPNLATWHDRLILMLGRQPSGIKLPGPHVRGITMPALQEFMELDAYFTTVDNKGSGFYPFPAKIAMALARIFPNFATAIFGLFERTDKSGAFIEVLHSRFYETNYYTGPAKPVDGS